MSAWKEYIRQMRMRNVELARSAPPQSNLQWLDRQIYEVRLRARA